MEYLVFVIWLVFFAWLVTKVPFFNRSGISRPQLVIVLLLKIIAGIFYGWIGIYYGGLASMLDTWAYHQDSVQEYHLLFSHPAEYFTNLFHNPYENGVTKFLASSDSYWNDLKGNVFVKILSVFDIFSFGYYYVNVIFLSFLTLFGPVAFYRVLSHIYPNRKMVLLAGVFCVPSFLYWGSGLHKEGLLFTGVAFVAYALYFTVQDKKLRLTRLLMLIIGLLLILVLRNFLILLMLPAMVAFICSNLIPKRGMMVFSGLYTLFIVLFFTLRYINPVLDFPQAVVNRQQDFVNLQGATSIPIKKLEPTATSFLENMPQAINLSTIRPYPSDVKHILSLAAAIEINALLLLFLLFLVWRVPAENKNRNFSLFLIFFSFSVLLAIGFSVNNLGAIVRYRSVILPLLVAPMVARIDWIRIWNLIQKYMKKNNN